MEQVFFIQQKSDNSISSTKKNNVNRLKFEDVKNRQQRDRPSLSVSIIFFYHTPKVSSTLNVTVIYIIHTLLYWRRPNPSDSSENWDNVLLINSQTSFCNQWHRPLLDTSENAGFSHFSMTSLFLTRRFLLCHTNVSHLYRPTVVIFTHSFQCLFRIYEGGGLKLNLDFLLFHEALKYIDCNTGMEIEAFCEEFCLIFMAQQWTDLCCTPFIL